MLHLLCKIYMRYLLCASCAYLRASCPLTAVMLSKEVGCSSHHLLRSRAQRHLKIRELPGVCFRQSSSSVSSFLSEHVKLLSPRRLISLTSQNSTLHHVWECANLYQLGATTLASRRANRRATTQMPSTLVYPSSMEDLERCP